MSDTMLHWAAYHGQLDVVKELLDRGNDVNGINEYNRTPLHDAASEGQLDVVKELLARGANVNAVVYGYGHTSLGGAVRHCHLSTALLLGDYIHE